MLLSAASNLTVQFPGKERDTETGLDYFMTRYFSSAQGRFTSPDPLLASARLTDPQTWNRYAYVRNDPVNMIDPDGRDSMSVWQYFESLQMHGALPFVNGVSGSQNPFDSYSPYYDANQMVFNDGINFDFWAVRNDQVLVEYGSKLKATVTVVEGPKVVVSPKSAASTETASTIGKTICSATRPLRAIARLTNGVVGMGAGGSIAVLVGLGGTEGVGISVVADPKGNVGIAINTAAGVSGFGASAMGGGQLSYTRTGSIFDISGWSLGGNISVGGGPAGDAGAYRNYDEANKRWGPWTYTATIGKGVGTRVAASSVGSTYIPFSISCGD